MNNLEENNLIHPKPLIIKDFVVSSRESINFIFGFLFIFNTFGRKKMLRFIVGIGRTEHWL